MTNLSIFRQDEVSENEVIRSRVAKTQQPDAERLIFKIFILIFSKIKILTYHIDGFFTRCRR